MKIVFNWVGRGVRAFIAPGVVAAVVAVAAAVALCVAGCYQWPALPAPTPDPQADPPAVALGHRLFRDGRFSQFFYVNAKGDANAALRSGDPVLATTTTSGPALAGAYSAGGMTCAACHLVDEQLAAAGGGMRAYADFTRRSPIPDRGDGHAITLRNTPSMVDAVAPHGGAVLLHLDGQFTSAEDLVRGTFTGRNFGWRPNETAIAVKHIASIVRGDDGGGDLAREFGSVPYRAAFAGAAYLPEGSIIDPSLRLNVRDASDDEVVDAVAHVVAAYMASLKFSRDTDGDFDGSPYDLFLRKNRLPLHPDDGEAPVDYGRRLRTALGTLSAPAWVGPDDGSYQSQGHAFVFGPDELAGLQLFVAEPNTTPDAGNCMACHPPPLFTDFAFHNTGVSQLEYDALFGEGAFMNLVVPALAERNAAAATFLPASAAAPDALGVFADVPAVSAPGHADLGLWNSFANPNLDAPQPALRQLLCASLPPSSDCSDEALLPLAIARFKTPGLRDLGQSAPFMHNGAFATREDVIEHYVEVSASARQGLVRNVDPMIAQIRLDRASARLLALFLDALDENYH